MKRFVTCLCILIAIGLFSVLYFKVGSRKDTEKSSALPGTSQSGTVGSAPPQTVGQVKPSTQESKPQAAHDSQLTSPTKRLNFVSWHKALSNSEKPDALWADLATSNDPARMRAALLFHKECITYAPPGLGFDEWFATFGNVSKQYIAAPTAEQLQKQRARMEQIFNQCNSLLRADSEKAHYVELLKRVASQPELDPLRAFRRESDQVIANQESKTLAGVIGNADPYVKTALIRVAAASIDWAKIAGNENDGVLLQSAVMAESFCRLSFDCGPQGIPGLNACFMFATCPDSGPITESLKDLLKVRGHSYDVTKTWADFLLDWSNGIRRWQDLPKS